MSTLALELDLLALHLDAQCGKGWVGTQKGQCRRATKEELVAKFANKTLHLTPVDESTAGFAQILERRGKTIERLESAISDRWNLTSGIGRANEGKAQALNSLRQGKNPGYGLITKTNDQGQPTGFLSYKPGRGRNVVLQSIGSDQSTKGSGRAMFEELAQYAIKNGKGIEVSAGDEAIAFYEKMGMKGEYGDLSMSADEVRAKYDKKTDSLLARRISRRQR